MSKKAVRKPDIVKKFLKRYPGWTEIFDDTLKLLRKSRSQYEINSLSYSRGILKHNIEGDDMAVMYFDELSESSGWTCQVCGSRGKNRGSDGVEKTLCKGCLSKFI